MIRENTTILVVDCSNEAIQQIKQAVNSAGKFSIIEYITQPETRKECDLAIMEIQKLVEENEPSIIITRIAWPGFDRQGFRLSARIKQGFPEMIIIGINEPVKFWEDYEERVKWCEMDYLLKQPMGEIPYILGQQLSELKRTRL